MQVFAKLRSDVIHVFLDNIEYSIPVELFFDASGKDDVRDHLIEKGHFIVLTDAHPNDNTHDDDVNDDNSTGSVEPATPSQEGVATMWRPSPRKANTDPLPQPTTQTHNQSLPVTSPSMWRPTKMTPTNLSFSEQ